jgi:hypothetical protein
MAANKTKKLSWAQTRMLEDIASGRGPCARIFGAAALGGASGTFYSLLRHGLISSSNMQTTKLTKAGRAALKTGRIQ